MTSETAIETDLPVLQQMIDSLTDCATGYLAKPFDAEHLRAIVAATAGQGPSQAAPRTG